LKRRIAIAATALMALVISLFAGTSPASASTTANHGCPGGAVCLWTNDESGSRWLNGSPPNYIFYSYGAHNISNAVGHGEYMDNQYGAASIGSYLCTGYNGTGAVRWQASGPANPGRGGVYVYTYVDFTPINSVKLVTNWAPNMVGRGC